MKKQQIKIINDFEIECNLYIREAFYMDQNKVQYYIFGILLNTLTLGLINIIYWIFPFIKKYILYSYTNKIANATYLYIKDSYGYSSQRKILDGDVILYKKIRYKLDRNQNTLQVIKFNELMQYQRIQGFKSQNHKMKGQKYLVKIKFNLEKQFLIKKIKVLQIIVQELTKFFTIFQITIVLLWVFQQQYFEAGFLFVVCSISNYQQIRLRYNQQLNLEESYSQGGSQVKVGRMNPQNELQMININSKEIVPGDLLLLEPDSVLQCDCQLVLGSVLIDDFNNSGSTTLVKKDPQINDVFIQSEAKIISSQSKEMKFAVAFVQATSSTTQRGITIRRIQYKEPTLKQYELDQYLFMIYIFLITLLVTIAMFLFLTGKLNKKYMLKRSLELIITAIPPELPAALIMGIHYSLSQIRKCKISCQDPFSIIQAGNVNTIIFDKNGTLTENKITIIQQQFEDEIIKVCMASCHNILIKNNKQIGNDSDLQQFQQSSAEMKNNGEVFLNNTQIHILKQFGQNQTLQTQSTIVEYKDQIYLFSKGDSQSIKKYCALNSVKQEELKFDNLLTENTKKGYLVITSCYKIINKAQLNQDLESLLVDMTFLHHITYYNQIKDQTVKMFQQLKDANYDNYIVTEDNLLTAIKIANDVSLFSKNIVICDYKNQKVQISYYNTERVKELSNNQDIVLNKYGYVNLSLLTKDNENFVRTYIYDQSNEFACTGQFFNQFILKGFNQAQFKGVFQDFLKRAKVYGQMSRFDKQNLVQIYQTQDNPILYAGDGVNDTLALQEAAVGFSINFQTNSLSSKFYTDKDKFPFNIVDLISLSKFGMEKSLIIYKFMAYYSILQYISIIICYNNYQNFEDSQYFYQDFFLCWPLILSYLITESDTSYLKVTKFQSLLSFTSILNLSNLLIIQFIFQYISMDFIKNYNQRESRNIAKAYFKENQSFLFHQDAEIIFLISNFLIVGGLLAFRYESRNFKLDGNYTYTLVTLVQTIFSIILCFDKKARFFYPSKLDSVSDQYLTNHVVLLSFFVIALMIMYSRYSYKYIKI